MDLPDRLGIEGSAGHGVAAVEEIGVHALEVLGPQSPQLDATDAAEYVQLDVAAVAVPGARPQRQLLEREPVPREVAADGGSGGAGATSGVGGELACE